MRQTRQFLHESDLRILLEKLSWIRFAKEIVIFKDKIMSRDSAQFGNEDCRGFSVSRIRQGVRVVIVEITRVTFHFDGINGKLFGGDGSFNDGPKFEVRGLVV